MPTISASLDDLRELLPPGIDLSLDSLPLLLELVKGDYKGMDEKTGELRIELSDTNRPDLWSPEGIARQIACVARDPWPRYEPLLKAAAGPAPRALTVDAALQEVRPFIGAFVAAGTNVTAPLLRSLIQTQEKLTENVGRKRRTVAIGLYPSAAIRFPVRYFAAAPDEARFIPLGMEEELSLRAILDRHPKGREYGAILAGNGRWPLLLDERGEVLSFPPIINSRALGEVRPGRQDLFVEATGTHFETVALALSILAFDLFDRGARIEPVRAAYPYDTPGGRSPSFPFFLPNEARLDLPLLERLLGAKASEPEAAFVLRRYGTRVERRGPDPFAATLPFRRDYLHPVDVVEDFAMARGWDQADPLARGFNSFPPEMPPSFTVGRRAPLAILEDRARDLLAGFGFEEAIGNVLMDRRDLRERMRQPERPLVEVRNVMSESYSALRDSLLPFLLRVEAESAKSLYPHRIFEVGEAAVRDDPEADHGSRTASFCSALIAEAQAGFSEAHAYLDLLGYYLGEKFEVIPAEFPWFLEGRSARVDAGGRTRGFIGELHPEVLERWGIRAPCAAFEVELRVPPPKS